MNKPVIAIWMILIGMYIFPYRLCRAQEIANCGVAAQQLASDRQLLSNLKSSYWKTHVPGAPPPEQGSPQIGFIANTLNKMQAIYERECRGVPAGGGNGIPGSGNTADETQQRTPDTTLQDSRRKAANARNFLSAINACDNNPRTRNKCRIRTAESYVGDNDGKGDSKPPGNDPATSTNDSTNDPERDRSIKTALAKDPETDYDGASCSYFTKPLVDKDFTRMNWYADGSCVAYGKFAYSCVKGRWKNLGPESVFNCKKAQDIEK